MGTLALLCNSSGSPFLLILLLLILLFLFIIIVIIIIIIIIIILLLLFVAMYNLTYYHAPSSPIGIQYPWGLQKFCTDDMPVPCSGACEICFNQSKALPRVVTHYLVIMVCLCLFLRRHCAGKLGYQYIYLYLSKDGEGFGQL